MAEYAKSPVDNVVTVTSIATVFRIDLRNRVTGTDCHDFPEIFSVKVSTGSVQSKKERTKTPPQTTGFARLKGT